MEEPIQGEPYNGPPFDREKPWTIDQCRAKLNEIQTQYQVDPERVEKAWQHCLDHLGKVLVVYWNEEEQAITIVG